MEEARTGPRTARGSPTVIEVAVGHLPSIFLPPRYLSLQFLPQIRDTELGFEFPSAVERALGPGSLLPPRLEDAGLEDCALPPESIKEAFLKAAAATGSRAASIFGSSADESDEEEGSCLNDSKPNNKQPEDVLVGISDVDPPLGACGGNKGGGVPEIMGNEVATGMRDAKGMTDKVVDGGVLPTGGREGYVDGLKGLDIGEKGSQVEEEDEERDGEIPILAEALV